MLGKRVRVKRGENVYEGIVMPSTTGTFVLKLDSGYNIGLSSYDEVEVVEEQQESIKTKLEIPHVKGKPEVSIISTGGTIASKVDYRTGAVSSQFTAEEIVSEVPEIMNFCNVRAKLLYNILSENMKPDYWRELARNIYKDIQDGAYGIIVTHGTDTLAYTSSAISFMVSTPVPVVFVGAQRSSDRPSSDNVVNLVCSASTAVSDIGEVVVVMHGSTSDDFCYIHRAVRVRKNHTSRRDAFQTVNDFPIGVVSYPSGSISYQNDFISRGERKLELKDTLEEKCTLIKFFPGLDPDIIRFFYDRGYRGFVIEGTGLGHVSSDWIEVLREISDDSLITMTSQCINGRVCDRVYDTGRDLLKAGVIEGEDMLSETALIKTMWLLGNYELDDAKKMMKKNLVGEFRTRTGWYSEKC
jgi:glutamyl-tRNA(Gln) amidotransferase subunit D